MIVGITGGIGSGKSTACAMFKTLGVPVISADQIGHHLIEHNPLIRQQITAKFGQQILNHEHRIDRSKIQSMILASQNNRIWLENLLHPLIKQEIELQTRAINHPYCLVEIPLLIEANMQDVVDRILTIDCPEDMQLARAMERTKLPASTISAIVAIQITRQQRIVHSDDIIDNSGDLAQLQILVKQQHKYYLSLR